MSMIKPNLSSLYISPLERCNLNCAMCYTCKTKEELSYKEIEDFIMRFRASQPLELVTFCGGEVFLLDWMTAMINFLTASDLIVEIITNGTIDHLEQLKRADQVNLIISLDGLEADHDQNRGRGSFARTWQFALKAIELGFHVEFFCVVSTLNYVHLDQFERWLTQQLGQLPTITYHPRKPLSYLHQHPDSNRVGTIDSFGFITPLQYRQLMKKKSVFPPPRLGCHQLSLMSNKMVYGCCEGMKPLGQMSEPMDQLIQRYLDSLAIPEGYGESCRGCVEPEFACGLKEAGYVA